MDSEIVVKIQEKVDEQADAIAEKAEKAVETVKEKVADKVIEQGVVIAEKTDNALEKVEDKVGDVTESVGEKIESVIEKIEEISPEVKKVVDAVESKLVTVVDGRQFTCFCSQWKLTLRITRRSKQSPLTRSEGTQSK